jgi:hypothetical protein
VAARWSHVLGVPLSGDGAVGGDAVIVLEDAEVRFRPVGEDGREGLVEIAFAELSGLSGEGVELGGVRLRASSNSAPSSHAFDRARAEAGRGKPLSDYVSEGRG